MSYKIITKIEKIDKNKWSEFVYTHTNGTIFQTPEMYAVYQNAEKYKPILLAVIDNNNAIFGILLAFIQKEYSGVLGNFTARSIVQGGPIIKGDDPAVLDFLLNEYDKIIKKKVIYSQFRNLRDWGGSREIFIKNGFEYEEHLNILIDLTKSEEQLWKEVHSKRRNEVRRAKKEGAYFSIEQTENSLKRCYGILQEVYDRAKLPIPDYNFFYNLFCMNSDARLTLFCANYKGEIIGCMLALSFRDTIYDFYAGSLRRFYKKYPNDLIPWRAFLWGRENDFKKFDFGGAGKPGIPYGVRDYKKKFGGEFVNYGRFEKIHKPFLFQFGKLGLKVWQKLK